MIRVIFFLFIFLFQRSYCTPHGIIEFSLQTCEPVSLSALIVPDDDDITLYGNRNERSEVPLTYENVKDAVKRTGFVAFLNSERFDTHEIFVKDKDMVHKQGLFKITIRCESGLPVVTLDTIDQTRKCALYKAFPSGGSDSFVIAIGEIQIAMYRLTR